MSDLPVLPVACGGCTWEGLYPDRCPDHNSALRKVAESVRTPMNLDAPAESEDYDTTRDFKALFMKSQEYVKVLKARISSREQANIDQFDAGVRHGREIQSREIANRLDANAARLDGNGSQKDRIAKTVLRVLAMQIRGDMDTRKEKAS